MPAVADWTAPSAASLSLKCFKQRPFNGNYCNTVAHFKCSISRPDQSRVEYLLLLVNPPAPHQPLATHTHTVGCINFRRSLLLNPVYFAKGLSRQLFNSRQQQQQTALSAPPVVMSAVFCGGLLMDAISIPCPPPFPSYPSYTLPTLVQSVSIEGHLMRGQVRVGLASL